MSRHRFHGDPERFSVLADFVADRYWRTITYIADVAGGQGMLTRLLTKKYNYDCEVIDPRVHVLKGVKSQAREFDATLASYYDLIIGLHPDEATRAVAQAALVRPAILIPCCNFWSEAKLGQEELLLAIEAYYREQGVVFERVEFAFKGPKNVGLVSSPPSSIQDVNTQSGSMASLYPDFESLRDSKPLSETIQKIGTVVMGKNVFAMSENPGTTGYRCKD